MENKEQQILSEIKEMMHTIRIQLEMLDAKMAELQQCVDPEDADNNPIELDIDDFTPFETVPEVIDDDLPFDDMDEPEPVVGPESAVGPEPAVEPEPAVGPEPVVEPEPLPEPEPVREQMRDDDDDDLPGVFDQPVTVHAAVQSAAGKKLSVAEVMAEKQAWRMDMPGSPVKDVRSAISLNDRIIFINHLFNEDPILFQDTIVRINAMSSLEEVVEYVAESFSQWDMGSELVYRFMMAVRRKVK